MNKTFVQRTLVSTFIVLALASIATGQDTNRVVDWPAVHLGSDAKVLEIVSITVNQTDITTGQPFPAREDWLEKLTFRIRNTSDKTITLFHFGVAFPELKRGDSSPGFSTGYGVKGSSSWSEEQTPIPPGAEVEVKLPKNQVAIIRQASMRLIGTTDLTRITILPGVVFFADGSSLGGISFRKP